MDRVPAGPGAGWNRIRPEESETLASRWEVEPARSTNCTVCPGTSAIV